MMMMIKESKQNKQCKTAGGRDNIKQNNRKKRERERAVSERDWKRKSREKKTYKLSRMREKNRERDRERRREQERWDTEGLQERASQHGSQRVCWPPAVMLAQHQQLDGQLATRTEPAGGASLAHNLSSLTHTQVRAHTHTQVRTHGYTQT